MNPLLWEQWTDGYDAVFIIVGIYVAYHLAKKGKTRKQSVRIFFLIFWTVMAITVFLAGRSWSWTW